MPDQPLRLKGVRYRCPICGSEVTVIRSGLGLAPPRCCHQDMKKKDVLSFFICPVCGSEALILREGDGCLAPRCCRTPMRRLNPMRVA